MRERSVSRAAEHMGLSQSAMSEVLARLRKRFKDPLLVRGRRGMQPTPLARDLAPSIHDVAARLRMLVTTGERFDPATCTTRFRVAASDYTQFLLMPRLVESMARRAPATSVDVLPVSIRQVEEALDFDEIDVAVAYFQDPPQGMKRQVLFSEHYVGIAARGHAALSGKLTAEAFAALRHISVAPSGLNYFRRPLDLKLVELGLARRVSVSSPHFLLAAHLVAQSDLVLVLPSRAARYLAHILPITIFDPPLDLPEFEMAMYWHERTQSSSAHRWFRGEVRRALRHD